MLLWELHLLVEYDTPVNNNFSNIHIVKNSNHQHEYDQRPQGVLNGI